MSADATWAALGLAGLILVLTVAIAIGGRGGRSK